MKNQNMRIAIPNPNMMKGCSGPIYSLNVSHDIKNGIRQIVIKIFFFMFVLGAPDKPCGELCRC